MANVNQLRQRMVDTQIARRGIRSDAVLKAMRAVPRDRFVRSDMAEFAYDDAPLPIGEEQTISQPSIVATMIEAAEVTPGNRVLEVGAGSGYAAAVLAHIVAASGGRESGSDAGHVFAVERHATLAQSAQRRLQELGYGNVTVRTGDGTEGWPDQAPFDAILVSAGGPDVPRALMEQLAIGGRLVMPVGARRDQTLVKLVRRGDDDFDREERERVSFVPLIGAQGWTEGDGDAAGGGPGQASVRPGGGATPAVPQMIADAAEPLPDPGDPGFGALFDRWGDRRVVLLGEASHGTSEFHRARAAITRRLVEEHGFTIVAAEADWPDAAAVDRYVRHRDGGRPEEPPFRRFPDWMWRNTEVADFLDWLHARNRGLAPERQAGFYGLDIYNMSGSIAAVLNYLNQIDPEAAATARERYGCLTPWQRDPATYGRAALTGGFRRCEAAVIEQCRALLAKRLDYASGDGDRFLDALQSARLVTSAERYYRIMYYGGAESWNLRDSHMFETLENLLEARGPQVKAVVWAHNSHIGDARQTDMGITRGELNIGQLCRERFGDAAALIGFGTHGGTVAAASDWDGEMEVKAVRPSRDDSYERLCHDTGISRFLLDLRAERNEAVRRALSTPRLERFIGVIYRPETELLSHYSEASLPGQFDAYVWFDRTTAVTPLGPGHARSGVPDTYPFGV
ncbi:protein-L-isoaspartate(D-aspartate) O-methyltransferase [Azospirillum picis]|uniref:Protein-L-isoaspartate O-methyltransferase n=1 Tax=Azospirillum picis TaxID=488438 RepID=A0ABU0MMA4_9PROT|nr:protein-L-isoaspartate(D-aspartate) O-methyltransferase [Azospirillum picis]MBP2301006.1 protein-L-isoaspartate(D-aspartate) O-methyltransferase [Azospirillum picis]MDQ0534374.1 protein-L-isoaspartate(D-aspartate) O-methyltransferase [Azospirillum picis]